MPTRARVTYIDAGTVVEGSDHTYTDTLPCLTDEPCTGPVVDGGSPPTSYDRRTGRTSARVPKVTRRV